MKLLILAALVALCTCWSWSSSFTTDSPNELFTPSHTEFTSDGEYEYRYESQMLTGLPTFSKQYAGMKVTSKVKLTFKSATACMLQMDEVQVLSWNKEIMNPRKLPPFKQISINGFSPIPSEQSRRIIEKLSLPVKFSYVDGLVKTLEITDEETNWSIDMKRSILAMLQVKLQADDFSATEQLSFNNLMTEKESSFAVLEPGLEGTCYSSLHVTANQENKHMFKVTKARDLAKCLNINVVDKNVYPQRETNCDCRSNMDTARGDNKCDCKPVTDLWNSSRTDYSRATTNYDLISQDGVKFLIHKAEQSVEHRMESPQAPNQYITTISTQTLVMSHERRQPWQQSDHSYSWKTVSEPWKMKVLPEEEESFMMSSTELMESVEKLWNEIVAISSLPNKFNDHMALFWQLINKLKLCNQDQLDILFKKSKPWSDKNHKQWQVYLDALKTCNTTAADTLLLSKIVSGEISNAEATTIFIVWTSDKVPTRNFLDLMMDSVLPALQRNPAKKSAYYHAMMCFGSLIKRYVHSEEVIINQCVLPTDQTFHRRNIHECHKYEKFIEGHLPTAHNEEEKIMVLKALTNLGSITSLPMLQQCLDKTESPAVRVHAVYAFNNLGYQNQIKVVQTLTPIAFNHHEETDLRIAAFLMVMKCDPKNTLWELQKHLNQEKDVEFKTFVVKKLKNILEDKEPFFQNSQLRIRQVLKNIKAFKMSEETTDFQVKYGFKDTEMNGDMFRMSTIADYSFGYPRSASIQQLTGQNNRMNPLIEIGYTANGGFGKWSFPQPFARQSPRDLRWRDNKPSFQPSRSQSPSITFYLKFFGQQVSFAHFDETTIFSLMQGVDMSRGMIEIPVALFHTHLFKPRETHYLQPSGAWFSTQLIHGVVMDIDGMIQVDMTGGMMSPKFTFKTMQPIRFEVQTINKQYVDLGFSETGLISTVLSRSYLKAQETSISYDFQKKQFVQSSTNPSNELFDLMEMGAVTFTYAAPTRLPQQLTFPSPFFKELQVDQSERKQFCTDLTSLKSVELNGKFEADVNMPALHEFLRGRMHLIPTALTVYKQHVRLTSVPVDSSPRKVILSAGSRYFTPDVADLKELMPQSRADEEESRFYSFLWKETMKSEKGFPKQRFFQSRLSSSKFHSYGISLASISGGRTLNMTASLTTSYESNNPTTRAALSFTRPPIPFQEEQHWQFVDKIASTVNTGTNIVLRSHNMKWGSTSHPEDHSIIITSKFRPMYKDNVCHEWTAYGCKDDNGVIYPIWYNNTMHVEYENNRIPEMVREALEPYLMNEAESVFMYPNTNRKHLRSTHSMDINFLVRPDESKIDIAFEDSAFVKTMSKLYCPLSTKFFDYITNTQYPISKDATFTEADDDFPFHHHQIDSGKDACFYQSPKFHTFDRRVCHLPQSECEVQLASDCSSPVNRKFKVSVIPSKFRSAPKTVKIMLGEKEFHMNIDDQASTADIMVSVDGKVQRIYNQRSFTVTDNGETVAIIKCSKSWNSACELISEPNGLYIEFDQQKLTVKIDSEKSGNICGMCAKHPQLPREPSYNNWMDIYRDNLVGDAGSCFLNERAPSFSGATGKCSTLSKHRFTHDIKDDNGDILKCLTTAPQPMCSGGCHIKHDSRVQIVNAKCVSLFDANRIGFTNVPNIQDFENFVEDDEIIDYVLREGFHKEVHVPIYEDCQ